MRTPIASLLILSLFLLAACGGDAGGGGGGDGPGATEIGELPTTIEVQLTDRFSVRPNPILVPAGVPVTLVVQNLGTIDHSVFVGDTEAHVALDEQMRASPFPAVDPAVGVIVAPGATQELIVTFDAGSGPLIAGCHIPGHYGRGMKANITVVG